MKRYLSVLLILCLVLITGCSNSESKSGSDIGNTEGVDYDLTSLGATALHAQMETIMIHEPSKYIGKVIRVRGAYDPWRPPEYNEYIQYIMIEGPTDCDKYLEFRATVERNYPEDYPSIGTIIEIQGVFGIYNIDEHPYPVPYLAIDDFVIV